MKKLQFEYKIIEQFKVYITIINAYDIVIACGAAATLNEYKFCLI